MSTDQETQTGTDALRYEPPQGDGVGIVWLDLPGKKVNTLNLDLLPEFAAMMDRIEAEGEANAIVIASGKPSGFIAGADIDVLDTVETVEQGTSISAQGQSALDRLANSSIPCVAAIHGDCLGGGLELALACTARVASSSPKTKLALPEVMLGLLPAAGGTQRLPQLIGLRAALDMMLTGRNIRAKKALRMGLVDRVVPQNLLLEAAREVAARLAHGVPRRRRVRHSLGQQLTNFLLDGNPLGRKFVLRMARKTVMKQSKGLYPAPLKILDAVAAGSASAESRGFGELLVTRESRGLRHLFRCITALKKDNGPGTEDVDPLPVGHVGMLGAGLMGAGVATVLADKGVTVRLKDRDMAGVLKALSHARKYYRKAVKRKRYKTCGAIERMERLGGGIDYAGFGQADLVIEAVFEDLELKRSMVAEIEARSDRVRPHPPIFASNTSSLPISEIAEGARYPERVIGMHFFSPVEKMPLVEIIVTEQTDPVVTATTVALARKMGKHVIVVGDCPGFYTTRALAPYMIESMFLALEGVPLPDIDAAAMAVGFPVGPITLMDEVGIDVGAKVIQIMKQSYGDRMEFPDTSMVDEFLAEGRKGRKSGKGFYVYTKGESKTVKGRKIVDPAVTARMGVSPQSMSPEAISERLILALVNEAAWCLHDGILREPRAGDLGAVMGIGFPPMEGGPFQYCDRIGVPKIVERLRALATSQGQRFEPCPLLETKEADKSSFYGG